MLMQVMNSEFIKRPNFNQEKYSKEIKKYFINEWLKNIINPMQMLMILRQSPANRLLKIKKITKFFECIKCETKTNHQTQLI